ncbi:prolyl oligopeptidase family serine peptidase [Altererythrobacter xixiisoli]|uniref:Prolyl oligopeptidase family serine peptidase n=1 Tax=Croceibacterium xixiisoli TaxID=1476466 RepID=A0A6I4TT37_9SPHN|nr:S9 family peptidase [Croceibacterium xixiisoli]MXO99044.1 prolyl oligopeptidase family serine peptidase [Croceibacterium xixiisoli]
MKLLSLAAAVSLVALAAHAQPLLAQQQDNQEQMMTGTQQGDLTFQQVFGSPSLNGPAPRGVQLSPDGRWLTLLRNREDDRERYDLWGYDRQSSQWRMLVDSTAIGPVRDLSEAEKMQRERLRIGSLKGIVTYEWAADGQSILVPIDGDLFLAGLDGGISRLTNTEEGELNPALSPSGNYVSFVRDRRLWVGTLGAEAVPVTPQEGELVTWGEAEFVAQEEMDRHTGYWWAPGDRRIAIARVDETPVGIVTRAAIGAEGTRTYQQRYPAAGTPNADVQLFISDPDGKHRVQVDLGSDRDVYLARVDWAPDGSALYVQRQDRAQTRIDMLKVDPATGRSSVLFTERARDGHWINLSNDYRFLKDGSLIWWSERDGFGHLWRFADGGWTQLTRGDWMVTSLAGVDQDQGRVYFTATRDDVLAQQIYALNLADPTRIERLSETDYVNSAKMDRSGKALVVTRHGDLQPPQSYLADGQGQRIEWIMENALDAAHPYAPHLASHRAPSFGTIAAEDGTPLHWMMITPELQPGKTYPVFFGHYGGPGNQYVTRGWQGAQLQAIVDRGYIYFEIDNRGSANRGVEFERAIYRAMGGVEVADQRSGAEYLKTLPYVDAGKIATYGWSYGGYLTLKMLEADPGLYAAGIVGAPVAKWELYDTHYTERFMGTPQGDAAAYARSDAIADAVKITDPMLLIHGMADDNVVFENATAIAATMQHAAVPFEMMLYPGQTHSVGGPVISVHLWESIFRFLERNGVAPAE